MPRAEKEDVSQPLLTAEYSACSIYGAYNELKHIRHYCVHHFTAVCNDVEHSPARVLGSGVPGFRVQNFLEFVMIILILFVVG